MASPLAILGQLAAGLTTVGAQGATGAYEGQIEGEKLKRQFAAEEQAHQLRALEAILRGEEIQFRREQAQQPIGYAPGTVLWDPRSRGIRQLPAAPQSPEASALHAAQARSAEETAALRRAQAAQVGQLPPLVRQEWESYQKANPTKTLWDFTRERLQLLHPSVRSATPGSALRPRIVEHVQLGKDGKPHLYQYRTVTDAEGNTETKKIDMGLAVPREGAGPRETLTTTERITPRKPIAAGTDTFNAINASIPDMVNEVTAQFSKRGLNFNVPGAYVKLGSGAMVRKEDVIAQAIRQRFGADATLRWDGSRFQLVKAWEPEQRQPLTSTRTVGPPGMVPRPQPQEEESEDEEE